MKNLFTKKRFISFIILFFMFSIIIVSSYKLYNIYGYFHLSFFILSFVTTMFFCFFFTVKFDFSNKTKKIFTVFIFIISVFLTYVMVELLNQNNMFSINFKRVLFNFIIIIVIYFLLYLFTNSFKLSLIVSNVLIFVLSLSNYVVTCFRGTPLLPWDIFSIKTAANIASNYTFNFDCYLIFALLIFILLISMATKANYKFTINKIHIIIRVILFLFVIFLILVFYFTNIIDIFNFETNLWEPKNEYNSNGFLASFIKQSKTFFKEKPNNYSAENSSNILKEYEAESTLENTNNYELPNIIVIMNESFCDLSINGRVETSQDYLTFFNNLTDNTIRGNTYVSVFGGQTPNSEWEFLTNNSMAFMPYRTIPYQQYIYKQTPSLARTLNNYGYTSIALHPWYSSGYRRNYVYPLLGFDNFLSIENLNNLEYIRKYPSDLSTYNEIIKLYENKKENEKLFNFTVTMQNHSGYDLEGYESNVFLTNIENCPRVEQYLSIMKESDKALEYLVNYFKQEDEKTIILFFGDHQPPYFEDEFWNTVLENTENETSKYITPFILWANYDISEEYVEKTSLNYLSILLLKTAGIKITPYMNFLSKIQEKIPVITGNGYFDIYGNYYSFNDYSKYIDILNKYQILQYNNVFDIKNRLPNVY